MTRIYVVEIPHQMPPFAWSADSKEAAIELMVKSNNPEREVYCELTGYEYLDTFNCENLEEFLELINGDTDYDFYDIYEILKDNGLGTIYYEYDGMLNLKPADPFELWLEENGHDLHTQCVFMSDKEALDAYNDENYWRFHQGLEARRCLKDELEFYDII